MRFVSCFVKDKRGKVQKVGVLFFLLYPSENLLIQSVPFMVLSFILNKKWAIGASYPISRHCSWKVGVLLLFLLVCRDYCDHTIVRWLHVLHGIQHLLFFHGLNFFWWKRCCGVYLILPYSAVRWNLANIIRHSFPVTTNSSWFQVSWHHSQSLLGPWKNSSMDYWVILYEILGL